MSLQHSNDTTEEIQHDLSSDEIQRYSRQLILPQFGVTSQECLKSRSILIVGVGGLGCPASLYLAGSGIGTLGLVDVPGDVVEVSNLHRQIAHSEDTVGVNKVKSASVAIKALNSNVNVYQHEEFSPTNAVALVKQYDAVLDCTDNVRSRYLISDACATTRVPLISGSAIGLDGQLTVYASSENAPCYRCIFPTPPPPACVGSCDSAGVLGPVPGVIGTLQALEALKIVGQVRNTSTLEGKLLLFDGAESNFRQVRLRPRSKTCSMCGDSPTIEVSSFDYDSFAMGGDSCPMTESRFPKIANERRFTPESFASFREKEKDYQLIDVRPKAQFDMCHLREAKNCPVDKLTTEFLDSVVRKDTPTVFICRRGNASRTAVECALNSGNSNVFDVIGGLEAWHHKVDKQFPLY